MKKRIIIWGTKDKGIRTLHFLNYTYVEIVAFTDNQQKKNKKLYGDIDILTVSDALNMDYDYIIIASSFYSEISVFLEMNNVPTSKIIQAFNTSLLLPRTLFFYDEIDPDLDKLNIFTSLEALVLGDF